MDKVYFHIAAYEMNKAISFAPTSVDFGPWEKFHTQDFEDLFFTIAHKVWGQWRYENDLPDYNISFLHAPREEKKT